MILILLPLALLTIPFPPSGNFPICKHGLLSCGGSCEVVIPRGPRIAWWMLLTSLNIKPHTLLWAYSPREISGRRFIGGSKGLHFPFCYMLPNGLHPKRTHHPPTKCETKLFPELEYLFWSDSRNYFLLLWFVFFPNTPYGIEYLFVYWLAILLFLKR